MALTEKDLQAHLDFEQEEADMEVENRMKNLMWTVSGNYKLDTKLDVHCEESSYTGRVSFPLIGNMKLSNTAAILIRSLPDEAEIIDG